MSKPTWKVVPSLPHVQVTNSGLIRVKGRTRTPSWCKTNKAWVIQLIIDGYPTTRRMVRLVGEAFCSSYDEQKVPRFKDGDYRNIHTSNIKWLTRSKASVAPYTHRPRPMKVS